MISPYHFFLIKLLVIPEAVEELTNLIQTLIGQIHSNPQNWFIVASKLMQQTQLYNGAHTRIKLKWGPKLVTRHIRLQLTLPQKT